ncbi:unnamed protein product [Arctia plantaginis]|uniref:RRM domain-containing protein n=1 Tax=Arctia plantaginis TaxID=874455 RepID=A0A8S0YX52_ARCPL|nr:unnamed protein product [Arctia plantaginis]
MSSYVDMSLEDIIKKKRETSRIKRKPNVSMPSKKLPIADARNKIISKKRTQITDAREKLAQLAKQKDARLKLEKLRLERSGVQGQPRNIFQNRTKYPRAISNKERVFIDTSRQVTSQPLHISKIAQNRQLHIGRQLNSVRQFNTNRQLNIARELNTGGQLRTGRQLNMGRQLNTSRLLNSGQQLNTERFINSRPIEKPRYLDFDSTQKLKPILRTVENDLEIIDDPMEDEYVPPKLSSNILNRQTSLQLKIIAHNDDIHDKRIATIHRSAISDKDKSPPRPPSILKKRPMAALRTDTKIQKVDKPLEYRIIVSNLRNTVTAGDIEELFGDVGGMLESRLVRPGTAEVIYKTQEDAQKAVDLYHNRQLDGQPMNCLLVTPRSPTATTARNSNKPALYSTNSNVEPDISTFHKVLFSNL